MHAKETATRRIGIEERRARLGIRHHLAEGARAAGMAEVARDLVGLHSSDPATVFVSATARLAPGTGEVKDIERALYDDRSVVRLQGMRRTMFVVPVDLAPVVHAACTCGLAARERRRLVQMLEQAGVATAADGWLRKTEKATLRALAARGEAAATELSKDVPGLRTQIPYGEGKKWQGQQGVGTRVLWVLAAEGRIARGRPRGAWTSSQYRWAPLASWLGAELEDLPVEPARAELVRRWLAAFGPGTLADLKWWTGWNLGQTRTAVAEVAAVEVELEDSGTGFVLAGDDEPVDRPAPWAALLPALDPTVMGWSERHWYLGDHRAALFDRNGNAGPTVWWDGRVVGGWGQGKASDVAFRLLEDVGGEGTAAIEAAAARLDEWLAGVRVIPRFRTPLERELAAS